MLLIRNAALPVVGIGLGAALCRRLFPRFDPRMLVLLWAFTTALGACARSWTYPARLVAANGAWATAWIAAASSVVLNNLPAAVFYSAREAHHRGALLLGFDLGPNLAVTGSLSAVLWLSAARAIDSRPSIATYSRLGALLVPLTLAGALAARSV